MDSVAHSVSLLSLVWWALCYTVTELFGDQSLILTPDSDQTSLLLVKRIQTLPQWNVISLQEEGEKEWPKPPPFPVKSSKKRKEVSRASELQQFNPILYTHSLCRHCSQCGPRTPASYTHLWHTALLHTPRCMQQRAWNWMFSLRAKKTSRSIECGQMKATNPSGQKSSNQTPFYLLTNPRMVFFRNPLIWLYPYAYPNLTQINLQILVFTLSHIEEFQF